MIEVKDGSINLLEFLEVINSIDNKIKRIEKDVAELKDIRWTLHRYVKEEVKTGIEVKLLEIIEFLKGE